MSMKIARGSCGELKYAARNAITHLGHMVSRMARIRTGLRYCINGCATLNFAPKDGR